MAGHCRREKKPIEFQYIESQRYRAIAIFICYGGQQKRKVSTKGRKIRTVIAASAVSVVLVVIGQGGRQGRPLVDQVRMLPSFRAGVWVSFDGLDDVLLAADGHVTRLAI